MLKTIPPLLNPDVLYALAAMGHGDTLVIADANFPTDSLARQTTLQRPLRIDGATAPEVMDAVLALLPLDTFIPDAALCMEVVGEPDKRPEVQQEVQAIIQQHESTDFQLTPVERFAFYEKARQAYAILSCGERRFYGCFVLTKGVIDPSV